MATRAEQEYSINYNITTESLYYGKKVEYMIHAAVDWSLQENRRWGSSFKEPQDVSWEFQKGLTALGYKKLLEHFGLLDWKKEFLPEKVILMSPAQLAAARREKEIQHNLPWRILRSQRLGFFYLAEEVI